MRAQLLAVVIGGRGAYHIISKIDRFNPSGLQLSIGAKVYF
jgi:hypothetical protein